MESTNNPVSQSGTEPLSGATGAGTVNQPYDQGNQYDGGAAQQTSEWIPSSTDTEIHPASASHGPHPTFAGNMLDPKTADTAYEETFGTGAPDIDSSASFSGQTTSGDQLSSRLGPPTTETAGSGTALGGTTVGSESTYGTTGVTGRDLGTTGATGSTPGSTGVTGGSYDTTSATGGSYGTTGTTGGSYDTTGATGGSYDTAGVTGGSYGSTAFTEDSQGGATESTVGSTEQSYGTTQQRFASDKSARDTSDTTSSLTAPRTGDTSVESRGSDTLSGGGSLGGSTVGGGAQGVNTGGAVRPEHQTDKTGVQSMHSNDPKFQDVHPTEANEARPNTNVGGFGTAESSAGADPSSAQKPEQKQQAADRPLDEPDQAQTEAIKKKGDAAEGKQSDPDDHSGEPMKMHDPNQQSERQGSIGQEGGGEHGKEKGTGEKWEKSTGLASEGGDFDASRPGAGKEANRILEEKGIHKDAGDAPPSASEVSEDKPGMMDKVKSALGMGK